MSTFGLGPSNVQPNELTASASLTSPDRLVEAFYRSGNPSMSNEHGRFPLIRTPNAVMSCTNDVNSFIQNCLSAASQTSPNASNLTATRLTPRQVLLISLSSSPFLQRKFSSWLCDCLPILTFYPFVVIS